MDLHNSYNLAALLSRLDIIAPYPTYKFLNEKHRKPPKKRPFILINWTTVLTARFPPSPTDFIFIIFTVFFFFISLYSYCFFTKNQNQNNIIEILNNINKHHCMFTAMAKACRSVIGQIITHTQKKGTEVINFLPT